MVVSLNLYPVNELAINSDSGKVDINVWADFILKGTRHNQRNCDINFRFDSLYISMNSINIASKETSEGISQVKIGIQKLNDAAQNLKAIV